MFKIKSIKVSEDFINAEVEVVLSDDTYLGIEVCLVIEFDESRIYPLQFGGCLGDNPLDPHIHHLFRKDCQGNSIEQLLDLHSKDLISIDIDPVESGMYRWGFKKVLAFDFAMKPDFKPTEERTRDMIQQLVEIALPDDLINKGSE
ncbi:hypothetical protein ES705_24036 [subsurface metagenome]